MARWGLLVYSPFTFTRAHPVGDLRESCMRENCTCSLSGGRRPGGSSDPAPPPTRLKVKGRWCYLYRAIDSAGATIDFLLSAFRDADAAQRLFRKALSDGSHPQPRVINTDLAPIYSSAIPATKKEGTLRRRCRHRPVQYWNNIIEQDHRAIKRRVNAKQGFREFQAARRTIQGYEVIHMLRKGQVRWVSGTDIRRQNQFINQVFELAA
jgi:transposase-like protein